VKMIRLTQGKTALVDDCDYALVRAHSWCAIPSGRGWRAQSRIKGKTTYMHRLLMGFPASAVDHKNLNSLDNRRPNLRLATKSQNAANSLPPRANTSGHKGVSRNGRNWGAKVARIWFGTYRTRREAAQVCAAFARLLFGDFARARMRRLQHDVPEYLEAEIQ
jgi:hypothetical protein